MIYLCMWTGTSGGIQVIYEHVRILRGLGIDARLGAHGPFRRCTWFRNDPVSTPAIDDCLAKLTAQDVLVVPELCIGAPELADVPGRRIAFVQNTSLLTSPLAGYESVLVPSAAIEPTLRQASRYQGDVHVVPSFLHSEFLFPSRAFTQRRPRVLLIDRPNKHAGEPREVQSHLHDRCRLDVEVTYVDQSLPRDAFTALFRNHDFYLHLSHPEGLPISILEAFGAGCLVIGFAGIGGLEFMVDGDNCFIVADGNVPATIDALAHALRQPCETLNAMLYRARRTAATFDEARTTAALARAFGRWTLGAAR
ncbi:MAG: glycosyltransferase [Planctomycetota bacterium]